MNDPNQNASDMDTFAQLVDRTKKTLKKHPNMSIADFVNGYLFPLLDEVRSEVEETQASVEDVWDYIGEIPEEPLLDEIEQRFLALAGFLDLVLVKAGWLSAGGPTDNFPVDMREQFVVLSKKLSETQDRISQARLLAASGEDADDEEDGEDEDVSSSAVGATAKPAEA